MWTAFKINNLEPSLCYGESKKVVSLTQKSITITLHIYTCAHNNSACQATLTALNSSIVGQVKLRIMCPVASAAAAAFRVQNWDSLLTLGAGFYIFSSWSLLLQLSRLPLKHVRPNYKHSGCMLGLFRTWNHSHIMAPLRLCNPDRILIPQHSL